MARFNERSARNLSGPLRGTCLLYRILQPVPCARHWRDGRSDGRARSGVPFPSSDTRTVGHPPLRIRGIAMLDVFLPLVGSASVYHAFSPAYGGAGEFLLGMWRADVSV
jgi:hypothetical protein